MAEHGLKFGAACRICTGIISLTRGQSYLDEGGAWYTSSAGDSSPAGPSRVPFNEPMSRVKRTGKTLPGGLPRRAWPEL